MNLEWSLRRRERLDGIADLLTFAHGASILDIGCHRGLVGYEFAKHGAKLVHGCDINTEAIEAAAMIFYDVDGCESRFAVADLRKGSSALEPFGMAQYSIVLMLGVYHKLKREMEEDSLNDLVDNLAARTLKFFAWNGYPEEYDHIDGVMSRNGLACVHKSSLTQNTAVWRRG